MVRTLKGLAVVTGGTGGIGRAVCHELAGVGYDVLFTWWQNEKGAVDLAFKLREKGVSANFREVDVRSVLDASQLAGEVERSGRRLRVLVNNAGVSDDRLLENMSYNSFTEVVQTNLFGTFNVTKQLLKHFGGWGRIVNVTSVIGESGHRGQCNYAASKAGVVGFTKSLASELASRNITVNTVSPGLIDTAFLEGLPAKWRGIWLRRIPMHRFGTPEDVAGLVGYLCGEKAGYVTGEVFHVDGGLEPYKF